MRHHLEWCAKALVEMRLQEKARMHKTFQRIKSIDKWISLTCVAMLDAPVESLMDWEVVLTLWVKKFGLQIIWFVTPMLMIQRTDSRDVWWYVCEKLVKEESNMGEDVVWMLLAVGIAPSFLVDWSKVRSCPYCSCAIEGPLWIVSCTREDWLAEDWN